MDSFITALQSLTDEKWNSLNVYEKLNTLQVVENEIAAREGLKPCQVSGEYIPSTEDGVTLGYYSQSTRDITINTEQLAPQSMYGSDYKMHLDTILHEGRHAYQHQVVLGEIEHSDTRAVQEWADNMAPGHYITYERNPRGYYSQPIERDARAFARDKSLEIEQEKTTALGPLHDPKELQPIVLKRNEDELSEAGSRNIEDILEARRDDYRDKGMVDGPEMELLIERERIELQTEFSQDAYASSEQASRERESIEQLFDKSELEAANKGRQSQRDDIEAQMEGTASVEEESPGYESGNSLGKDKGMGY